MKQSTSFAHVATNLLNVLQGYTKGIRFVVVLTVLLVVGIGQAWGQYTKASSIAVGDVVVLVYESGKKELSSISDYGVGTSYNETPAGVYELTVEAGSSSGTFSLKNGSTYLSWSSGNSLATSTTKNVNSSWKITFSNGNPTIVNAKDNTRKLQWNASSPRFACYTSSQKAVQLYKKSASYTVNWTINPAAGGILSATSGNTTTVTPNTAYTYGNPAYTVSPVGKATVSQDGDNFTATPSANCTIQINMVEKTPANISFENMGNPTPITTGYYVGDTYKLPTKNDYTCGDKTFVGWSTKIIENSPTKPTAATYFEPGASVTLGATNTFYAVFAETGGTPTTSWSKTDIANIKSTDEVAITMSKGEFMWALSSSKGTKDAPDAILVEQGNLEFAGALLWNIQNDEGDLTIYPNGTTSTWLYCTNANDGVRVGTNTNKTFTISGNYLKHTGTSRYVGVYVANPDWRCYTSTTGNSNIAGQTLAFYKKTTTSGYQNYTTECSTPTEFTVSFDANGHGTAPTQQTVTSGGYAQEPNDDPSETGYNFQGWYNNSSCTGEPFDFENTPITDDITLYAKWTAIQTTITLNANGGSGNTTSVAATYDSSTLNPSSITNPTKTGHTFGGWYSGEGGIGSLVINSSGKLQANVSGFTGTNGVWKATTNKTLYAKWTPTVYAINYKDQGGANFSGQHEAGYPQNHTYNTATTLKSASKNHYTFDGWYKENDCSGIAVTTLGATEYTDNITLYAKWTAKTYTITLDANGGTFVDKRDSQTKGSATFDYIYGTYATYNDAPNLTEYYSDLKRDGYQFDKWVSAGSPWNKLFTSTGDRTIQAQWSKLYTITLYENDTEIKLTPQTSTTYKLPAELTAGSCLDDTKELVGWSTVAIPTPGDMPTSDFYKKGETVTLSKDKTTFYAVFATPTTIPGGTEEKEVVTTLDFSNQGYENQQEVTSLTIGEVTVTFNKGSNNNAPKYYNTGTAVRVYGGGYFTVSSKNITKIAITTSTGEDSNAISADCGTYDTNNKTWTGSAQSVKFTVGGTTGHRRIKSVKVTYTTTVQAEDIVTYSNYSTTCVPAPKLVSIAQTAGQIEFTEGDEFVKATITATYEDESTKDVTSKAIFSTPDMTQVGEQTISVSYKEGEVTAETSYKINIKEKPKYTITWWANGEEFYTQTDVEGTTIEVPTTSLEAATYACDDKVFVGWLENEIDEATDEEPTFITDFDKITENKDFFAVFATEENNDESIFVVGKSGDFKIYAVVNGENKYATAYNNGKLGSTSEENSAVIYTFTHKGENQYTIYNGSKYIAYGTEGTDLKTQSDEYLWKIAPATNGKGSWRITSVSTTSRAIIYRTSYDFKAYGTTNITSSGYYDIEIGSVPTTTYSGYVTTCEKPTYTRVVKLGEYGTICLPYGSSDYTGAEFYEVSSVEYGKGLWLDQLAAGTALAAGKPYIFRATAEKLVVVYKGEKKDSPADGVNGLTGTFTAIAANSTLVGHYIIALNQIWVANDKNTLPAYRAYIKNTVPTTPQAQIPGRRRVCMGENAATGFENVTNGENITIKVIENGQLFIIRNGEKYNIQGQKL